MYFYLFSVQNFTKAGEQEAVRCDTQAQLIERGCQWNEIISPGNNVSILKEVALSKSFNQHEPVQLTPQKIRLRLRPGWCNQLMLNFNK